MPDGIEGKAGKGWRMACIHAGVSLKSHASWGGQGRDDARSSQSIRLAAPCCRQCCLAACC
jgi:hypothetical protein